MLGLWRRAIPVRNVQGGADGLFVMAAVCATDKLHGQSVTSLILCEYHLFPPIGRTLGVLTIFHGVLERDPNALPRWPTACFLRLSCTHPRADRRAACTTLRHLVDPCVHEHHDEAWYKERADAGAQHIPTVGVQLTLWVQSLEGLLWIHDE